MIRAEQYLKAHPDTPLSRHRPEEVSAYLTEVGRKGSRRVLTVLHFKVETTRLAKHLQDSSRPALWRRVLLGLVLQFESHPTQEL